MRHRKGKTLLRRLAAALSLAAGVGAALAAMPARAADAHFVLISHAPDSDSWWNTIKNAIQQADDDFNVQTDYRNPPNGDIADMARLIEQAAARNYDGVITTIADFDVLKSSIGKVTEKKIPLVTINSGTEEQSEKLGAIMHIGQPEYVAGHAAGEKAKAAGVKSFVCVNHLATNTVSFDRCRGFADAIGVNYKSSTIDSGTDPTEIQAKVSAYLRNHPDTGAILTLGPVPAAAALKAVQQMGLAGKINFYTFDFSDDIAKAIRAGTIQFAIDQQPYLQGYIPVAVLAIVRKEHTTDPVKIRQILEANPKFKQRLDTYGLQPSYGPRNIRSGPGFITKENLDKVVKYAGQYR
ncbi:sugar ABC transporter substrate-binding protein [Paraburkholderia caballeronis]|uniref:Monosaccharide ABC transporter substrate-binding protein, CUT2 family n=1 Tax=Paraburkholderia caballeronis TaxID=416943 RepID=A0A1H7V3B2_9BURK|nr:sugar ABC transporter substrate-binding protein [Paraburkholderia caballeronis]PXW16832.1 monosaccharide ABC transporter substrate-binding protein (CUT2 family) [Paraburkholderia caballeronis]PXW94468.1 monosaccharide ABC transporter substrate-binding protein (CUT2 family) [Paraburkholderia caballeronis]RAJ89811.1 monosaccharide ABC transporter substrate-binding protein (CUT2 family) [Paraburkholderia caballeronis]TDV04604.1 monosaccharide ABC transporter substrate-binding protein (CUT2 fami